LLTLYRKGIEYFAFKGEPTTSEYFVKKLKNLLENEKVVRRMDKEEFKKEITLLVGKEFSAGKVGIIVDQ
jgi:hypothetical protein